MSEKVVKSLHIDQAFKELIRPLLKQEYRQLEANIVADGCRDPITTWHGVIIDGHNRYEICTKHHIPFSIVEMEFSCREEVIAWICANQLGRRNLTEETRKFLIGKQYESEKIANTHKNAHGINQYRKPELDSAVERAAICQSSQRKEERPCAEPVEEVPSRRRTANRIADANHISHGTVEKYAAYARALEEIGRKTPEMVTKILSGQYKVSHQNVVELSRMEADDVREIMNRIERTPQPFVRYNETRQELQHPRRSSSRRSEPNIGPSVKDMPAFDPDAEVTGLTLTIPSWSCSIARIQKTDLTIISDRAREKLEGELLSLDGQIQEMLSAIRRKK